MLPFIGVTSSAESDGSPVIRPAYVRAVTLAGGLPVALPFVEDLSAAHGLLERLGGVVLTGSEDLDSSLWNEPLHRASQLMHPARQRTELLLCQALLERDLPLLGICGGMQNLAVAAGGSIHQHLPDLGDHVLDHSVGTAGPTHTVSAVADCRLAKLVGPRFEANSAHHQAVARLPDLLRPVAHTDDGVLEAFELPGPRFLVGVQWHPEQMPGDAGQQRLFSALVSAARG